MLRDIERQGTEHNQSETLSFMEEHMLGIIVITALASFALDRCLREPKQNPL